MEEFLMHRVELKVLRRLFASSMVRGFLMHRVELKALHRKAHQLF